MNGTVLIDQAYFYLRLYPRDPLYMRGTVRTVMPSYPAPADDVIDFALGRAGDD